MQAIKPLILMLCLCLVACTDPVVEQIAKQTPVTEQRIEQLGQALDSGKIRNAKLINDYADRVLAVKPELATLVAEFRKDASRQGPMYQSLLDRYNTAVNQPQMFANHQALYDELINIYQAADPVLYSDALSDPLNVLADMSDGALPRVNSLSKEQTLMANNAQDFGTGDQLIGNPNYGQWQNDSSGSSFWVWYGQYALLRDLLGGNRVYYDRWGSNRGYSYYHDYGRSRYSSPSQLRKQTQIETRTRKSFESRGQKFTSAYSKNRTGSSGLSRQSASAQTSSNKFRANNKKTSSFASKSKYASKASFRDSQKTTSRSFRRGK
ncbi:hypothetical protein [Thalassotalea aquiviva]|uniref:hypothetical protein n=1 Tax=Thalassotalea aquiviva TaxID=3242415 RepID=UPI00352AEC35